MVAKEQESAVRVGGRRRPVVGLIPERLCQRSDGAIREIRAPDGELAGPIADEGEVVLREESGTTPNPVCSRVAQAKRLAGGQPGGPDPQDPQFGAAPGQTFEHDGARVDVPLWAKVNGRAVRQLLGRRFESLAFDRLRSWHTMCRVPRAADASSAPGTRCFCCTTGDCGVQRVDRPVPCQISKIDFPKQNARTMSSSGGSLYISLTMSYFHTGTRTIIGAEAFHFPVRDGKEWDHLAMVIRLNWTPGSSHELLSQFIENRIE